MKLAHFNPSSPIPPQDDPAQDANALATGGISVWDNSDSLREFAGAQVPGGVAWWIPDRHRPTAAEAFARLEFLSEHGPSPYAFPPLAPQRQLSIGRTWLDNADVHLLIVWLNSDLLSRYPEPGAVVFSLEAADIVDPVGTLLIAELDGEPVGCGAFRVIDDQPGSAEIKRMYVTLAGRGNKIGAALLAELERAATAFGVRRFALETGPRQPEALRLYERAGYVRCEPWGQFVGRDFSICMEKIPQAVTRSRA